MMPNIGRLSCACLCLAGLTACSVKRIAVNKLGNALASGGSTYESDDDPELVAQRRAVWPQADGESAGRIAEVSGPAAGGFQRLHRVRLRFRRAAGRRNPG